MFVNFSGVRKTLDLFQCVRSLVVNFLGFLFEDYSF